MKVVALALVVWSSTHTPTRINEIRSSRQVEQPNQPDQPAVRLSPKQKAWFGRAIEHILQGD